MTELGAEIGAFATNNYQRVRVALICFVVGGVAGPIGWEWLAGAGTWPFAPMALLVLCVIGVGIGLALSIAALRHRGERFTLYEKGVVRARGRRTTELRWADISAVRIVDATSHPSTNGRRDTKLGRVIGGDLACTLTLSAGGRLRFNGFTANARSLADGIKAAVEDGAAPGTS